MRWFEIDINIYTKEEDLDANGSKEIFLVTLYIFYYKM